MPSAVDWGDRDFADGMQPFSVPVLAELAALHNFSEKSNESKRNPIAFNICVSSMASVITGFLISKPNRKKNANYETHEIRNETHVGMANGRFGNGRALSFDLP